MTTRPAIGSALRSTTTSGSSASRSRSGRPSSPRDDPSAQASCSRPKRWSTNTWRKRTPRASNMVGGMGTFIELRLTTGEKRHVETGESNAQTEIDRWAQREKTSWIETVEGIWVNPEHILEVRLTLWTTLLKKGSTPKRIRLAVSAENQPLNNNVNAAVRQTARVEIFMLNELIDSAASAKPVAP